MICQLVGAPEEDRARLTAMQHDFPLVISTFAFDEAQVRRLNEVVALNLGDFEDCFEGPMRRVVGADDSIQPRGRWRVAGVTFS